MKEICKHRLPCGRCDKFNISCDLTLEDIEQIDLSKEVLLKPLTTCNHDWHLEGQFIDCEGEFFKINTIYERYRCCICDNVEVRMLKTV